VTPPNSICALRTIKDQIMSVKMQGRCTTCRKLFDVTPLLADEAKDFGCLFSPCCQAVATVERVTVKQPRTKPQLRRDGFKAFRATQEPK
jgi:hypothetical protein